MGLKHGQEEQHHQDGEQYDVVCCLPPHGLEAEIDKRTKARGIEGGHAEDEHESGHNPHPDVLTFAVVGIVDFLFQLLAPSRKGEEGEEGSHRHNGVDMSVAVEGEAAEVEGKHARDKGPGQVEVLDTEEHPDNGHGDESEDNGRHRTYLFHHLAKEEFVEADEEAV